MLERLLVWFLNNYIGEYFDNVNTDQLSIAYSEGEIELEGLPLKTDAFKHLNLPIDIKAGYIGKIRLKGSYRISSEPWLVSIEELYLVGRPLTDFGYNEDKEKQGMQEDKLNLLQSLESKWKIHYESRQEQSYYASSYSTWLSYSTSLVTNIIENLQLKINTVHFRYEDDLSVPGFSMACGIVVKNLSAHSTDETCLPKFVTRDSSNTTRKLVQLEDLSTYWDSNVTLISDLELPEMVVNMRKLMDFCVNSDGQECDHQYILAPISGKALIRRNCSEEPLKTRSKPRLGFDLELQDFSLTLNILQYRQLLTWFDEFTRMKRAWKYRKWRPGVSLKENPKLWWKFAVNANLDSWRSKRCRQNWHFVTSRVRVILKYCDIYYEYLSQPELLSKEMKDLKEKVEYDLSYEEICCLREAVFDRCQKINRLPTVDSSSEGWWLFQTWIPSWFYKYEAPKEESEAEAAHDSFQDEILDAMNTVTSDSLLTRDTVFAQINFTVQRASFLLIADAKYPSSGLNGHDSSPTTPSLSGLNLKPILEFELVYPEATIETSPRFGSHKIELKLDGLFVRDRIAQDKVFKNLISPQNSSTFTPETSVPTSPLPEQHLENGLKVSAGDDFAKEFEKLDKERLKCPLFELSFEKKHSEITCCNRLFVHSRPLEIVYNHRAFDAFVTFFSSRSSKSHRIESLITRATRTQYEEFKKQTKAGIQNAVDDLLEGNSPEESVEQQLLVRWEFDLDISAPQVIVPENFFDSNSALVICDLGRLQFRNIKTGIKRRSNESCGSDENEQFITPPTTPVLSDSEDDSQRTFSTVSSLANHITSSLNIYEGYVLEMSDIQLLVAKAKDNWKFGLGRGSGAMHILNRFSISLQLERRMTRFSSELPRVILKGSLPKLAAYLNEAKLGALVNCVDQFKDREPPKSSLGLPPKLVDADTTTSEDDMMAPTEPKPEVSSAYGMGYVFFVSDFCIEHVSVAIQSRGENLVEMQVMGVQAKYERSKYWYSISSCVHSLLLIDAYQKYGREYDILLASHKNISMDSSSGRLRDAEKRLRSLSNVISSLADQLKRPDALISITYTYNKLEAKESISVVFNNFDVIANQETMIELVSFFKRVIPSKRRADKQHNLTATFQERKRFNSGQTFKREITLEFRQLNVLLLRTVADNDVSSERKLATATVNGAYITGQMNDKEIFIDGSLSGLQVVDVFNSLFHDEHQQVVNIGVSCEELKASLAKAKESLSKAPEPTKAFSFSIRRAFCDDLLEMTFRLVSLSYMHSPKLLQELASCAAEFKAYMSAVAHKIKDAAAEVAKGIVSKAGVSPNIKKQLNLSPFSLDMKKKGDSLNRKIRSYIKDLRLQIHFETPVIILPSSLKSLKAILKMTEGQPAMASSEANVSHLSDRLKFVSVGVEVKNGSLRFIDDCNDTDIPLLELNASEFILWHKIRGDDIRGNTCAKVSCDYFNRALSGWEPFLEPWKFDLNWDIETEKWSKEGILQKVTGESRTKKCTFNFSSQEVLNVNLTSTLLDLYRGVKKHWEREASEEGNDQKVKRRLAFVPFAVKNETGCKMYFSLVNSSAKTLETNQKNAFSQRTTLQKKQLSSRQQQAWIPVDQNEVVPFSFESSYKLRSQESHVPKTHKIVVHIEGWLPVFPVSVDRVGTYFREAKPEDLRYESARIVFDISLEANAQKMITIRSALVICNKTDNVMELKFDVSNDNMYLMPGTEVPVSLRLIRSKMRARPCEVGVNVCENPLQWEHVRRPSEYSSELSMCTPISLTRQKHSSYNYSLPYYFCVLIDRKNFPPDIYQQKPGHRSIRALPAHHISLLPPIQLVNLLPFELKYKIPNTNLSGSVKSGDRCSLHCIDTTKEFMIDFSMDYFTRSKSLSIASGSTKDYTISIELFDVKGRLLLLCAQVNIIASAASALQINIIAPYWFVNRTGLPLLFKQEGSDTESAGQFEEHEMARSISPLLFSYYDAEAQLTCSMRLGRALGNSRWCHSFYLEKGTQVRRLRIVDSDMRRPDKVYEVGIDIRKGRGRYRDTKVVTLTPRYQIENSSTFQLEITQKFATNSESDLKVNIVSVLPKSNVAFHWPRTDHDRLLCIRMASLKNCHWSGGFPVLPNTSFHLNIRDENGSSHFLRVEILSQNATSFIVLTDTNNLPPPIRVDNFTEVPIEFYQTGAINCWMRTLIRPHSSLPYVWDEPTLNPHITVCAPGGSSAAYNMYSLRPGDNLTYENFFYIAFSATFLSQGDNEQVMVSLYSSHDLKSTQLALDVTDDGKKVIVNRKELGKRSQLWRMDSSGHLLHEGSSPPRDPRRSTYRLDRNSLVLDIATNCALPGEYVDLVLRKIDKKRALTQTWTFNEDGRLCCEYPNLYVQPKDGFMGLKARNQAVLGPDQVVTYSLMPNGIPFEQAVSTQKMRKGSGMLAVSVVADGPTRVLQVVDVRNVPSPDPSVHSHNWVSQPTNNARTKVSSTPGMELQMVIEAEGLGLSIINRQNEELIYTLFNSVILEYTYTVTKHSFNCSVKDIRIDNQLREAQQPIVLFPAELDANDPMAAQPTLRMSIQKLVVPQVNAQFFPEVQFKIKDMTFNLEELLLLKLYEFVGFPWDGDLELIDETEGQNAHKAITSALAQSFRLYLTLLEIVLNQVRLSVFTSSHLPLELNQIKKKVGLMLIGFEDAYVLLKPFRREYSLETFQFLVNAVIEHYKLQLKKQAAKILVSVDFLGNPLGLVNDVSDGISELINEGSVGGLITNITHGLSNSTAKFMSSLSDSLDVVTMDERHQEIRRRIRHENTDHLRTGLKGLGVGIMGGVTSILTQTYEGAASDGIQGLVSGFGKGLLGTFTKPAVGMLDFATEAASAVRDTSRKISHHVFTPQRVRLPRQCIGIAGGLLLRYDPTQAEGQQFFIRSSTIHDKDDEEVFNSFDVILPDTACLITNERVRFLTWGENSSSHGKVLLSISFEDLVKCNAELNELANSLMGAYVVLVVSDESSAASYAGYGVFGELRTKTPKVRCSSDLKALKTCEAINYAKNAYEERKYTVTDK